MTMADPDPTRVLRRMAPLALAALLAGCSSLSLPGGFDLISGPPETETRAPTAPRPEPDARGVISYPNYQVAVAQPDDTVRAMAGRLGLGPDALADANGLPADARLRQGELLLLPSRVAASGATPGTTGAPGSVDVATLAGSALDRAEGREPTASAQPTASATAPAGAEPRRHTVQRGETAYSIARRYNVSARAIGDWNGLNATLDVREGQVLLIPVTTGDAPEPAPAAPGTGSTAPEPPSAAAPQPEVNPPSVAGAAAEEAENASPPPETAPQTAASDTAQLAQPVPGQIIRGYAPGRNEGVDFGADAGAPVRAAAAGTVAAITQDTDQIQIVVLRHDGGLLTVYANVDDIIVERGTTVARGQRIGAVAASDNPFLHFEVLEGASRVDPVPYLTR
ncbi:peptidoglycan DD-metalloendopeptidase family protein [Meridianimarinicoccus sp. RP-17]